MSRTAAARAVCGVRLALCLLLVGASGCGDGGAPETELLTGTRWLEDPGAIEEMGYEVQVDIGWRERPSTCFALSPNLRITVNDREPVPVVARADCEWDVLVILRGFASDTDLTVKLHDGERLLGEAKYTGMFPGFSSWQLASPADGRVRAGESLALAGSQGAELYVETLGAYFHWLDMAAATPPFKTFAAATAGPDRLSAQVAAPLLTGRALMVMRNVGQGARGRTVSCTGFSTCSSRADASTIGPFPVEVIP